MSLLSGSCSLLIRGEGLDKQSIDRNLNMAHTGFTTKGQPVKCLKMSAPKDLWTYEIKFKQDEMPIEVLGNLLMKLNSVKNFCMIINSMISVSECICNQSWLKYILSYHQIY